MYGHLQVIKTQGQVSTIHNYLVIHNYLENQKKKEKAGIGSESSVIVLLAEHLKHAMFDRCTSVELCRVYSQLQFVAIQNY